MANTLKNELAQNVGTSAVTLYTCPAATKTIIIGMTCSNVHTNTQVNVDIYLTSSSNDYHIIKNGTIKDIANEIKSKFVLIKIEKFSIEIKFPTKILL